MTGTRIGPLGRRQILRLAVTAVPAATLLGYTSPAASASAADGLGDLAIRPRTDWAGGRAPTGPMGQEADGDVRFLLVHHSVSTNDYDRDDVAGLIGGFYDAHTAKSWPDVAYNFFVDRFGGIWEGRYGSTNGPVIADATGGNQGFSQLCCLIGDFRAQPPSGPAVDSLTRLLAALADRYRIDTAPDARTQFVSRGSNRWPRGRTVTTPTIAGHRDMSRTECPGDACYALIRGEITGRVNGIRATAGSPPATDAAGAPTAPGLPTPPDEPSVVPAISIGAATAAVVGAAAAWVGYRRTSSRAGRPGGPSGPQPPDEYRRRPGSPDEP